jgi:hypothetical protein
MALPCDDDCDNKSCQCCDCQHYGANGRPCSRTHGITPARAPHSRPEPVALALDRSAGPAHLPRKHASIEAHLTIVLAALAVCRWIEHQTGWSIRKFVKTSRRYRTIQIQTGLHVITAAAPLPDDLLQAIERSARAHLARCQLRCR